MVAGGRWRSLLSAEVQGRERAETIQVPLVKKMLFRVRGGSGGGGGVEDGRGDVVSGAGEGNSCRRGARSGWGKWTKIVTGPWRCA